MTEQPAIPLSLFEHRAAFEQDLAGKELLLFLDYDGTLTPIVATPDLAVLSEDMRQVIQKAMSVIKISIVSGRATQDVRSKVKLDGLFYAGSHGFEIVDPQGEVTVNEEAQKIRSVIDEVHGKLSERVKGISGALVENVKYTISAHYRLVSEEDFPLIETAVDAVLAEYPQLRKTHGKKVFELRPRIDWDKGRAVEWILTYLGYDPSRQIPVYIGDDTTDEDAFRFLKDKGFGILVADPPKPSEAKYRIRHTEDVRDLLEQLIALKSAP